jgi:hypothetical protein
MKSTSKSIKLKKITIKFTKQGEVIIVKNNTGETTYQTMKENWNGS